MIRSHTTSSVYDLVTGARGLAETLLALNAEATDRDAAWPDQNMRALAEAGFMGLHVPVGYGGRGEGLLTLARVTEELGAGCSSTAMCYGMHCVATAVIAAKATPDQVERYLRPIAAGRHITTLALSEPGTGAHFYVPRATFEADGQAFRLNGRKSFVTNGGQADSYVVSAVAAGEDMDPGTFTCLLVDAATPNLAWGPPWAGFGMRGNSSRSLELDSVAVARANLLGAEGDQLWYVFEIVAPYFLVAMAGSYLGIARQAMALAIEHLKQRQHDHTSARLSENAALTEQVADMWVKVERCRSLLHHAASLYDAGDASAGPALFAAKIEVADTVVGVTNAAMTLMGGQGYQQNGALGRLQRDAQAAHIMSPTTHLLKSWLGRSALGLPAF